MVRITQVLEAHVLGDGNPVTLSEHVCLEHLSYPYHALTSHPRRADRS